MREDAPEGPAGAAGGDRDAVGWAVPVAALVLALVGGHAVVAVAAPVARSRMFPWIAARGLGLASFLTLSALVVLGLWPKGAPGRGPRPATRLRAHASLAAATVVLVAGHLTALALDRYAHVGWVGALVPGGSAYRTLPVAAGTVAFYLMALITLTAATAGAIGRRTWLPVHRLALVVYASALLHGITAGSDTASLRAVYAVSGAVVGALAAMGAWSRRRPAASPVPPATAGVPGPGPLHPPAAHPSPAPGQVAPGVGAAHRSRREHHHHRVAR